MNESENKYMRVGLVCFMAYPATIKDKNAEERTLFFKDKDHTRT